MNYLKFLRDTKTIRLIDRNRVFLFYVAYSFLFVSWFCHDVSTSLIDIYNLGKYLRLISYALFVIQIPFVARTKKEWIYFFIGISISAYYFLETNEIFFIVLITMMFLSIDIKIDKLIYISFYLLFFSTLLVIIFSFLNLTNNVITPRGIGGDFRVRYSFGFYHSNVLPLNVFYLLCYYILIKQEKVTTIMLLIMGITSSIVYFLCLSRNSFLISITTLLMIYIGKKNILPMILIKSLNFCSKYIVFIYTGISLLLSFLLYIGVNFVSYLDISVFSGRITFGLQKIQSIGIHFFQPLNYSEYTKDLIIVDNGYISTLIHYGILLILILCVLNYLGAKKYKNNYFILVIIIAIGTVNFIDNDIFSYCCFGIWLGIFNRHNYTNNITYKYMKNKEKISVIMSTYNETKYELEKSIESILNQTYTNFEFIIINDNPHSNLLKTILNDYAYKDSRIKLIFNKENRGLVYSLNEALKYCQGNYVARMDADDIAITSRLEKQLLYLNENEYDFVGSYIEFIDEKNELLHKKIQFPTDHFNIKLALKFGNCIAHPTWIARKKVFDALHGYRNIPYCEDYDFVLRASQYGFRLGNLPQVGLYYRIRKNGISESNKLEQKFMRYYLADNRKKIFDIDENVLQQIESSKEKENFFKYQSLKGDIKELIRKKDFCTIFVELKDLMFNKFFYKELIDKIRNFSSS